MIQLPTGEQFKVKGQRGFLYNIIQREGLYAIAEQFDTELNKVIAYEVFKIQQYKDRTSPDGKTFIPAKEALPSTESWGTSGWTCFDIEEAKKKYNDLLTAYKKNVTI